MTLYNSSDGVTAYRLVARDVAGDVATAVAEGGAPDVRLCPVATELVCDAAEGDIPARAFKTVTLTLLPRTRGDKNFAIEVISLAPHGPTSPSTAMRGAVDMPPKSILGMATVRADFPHAIVSDVSQVNGPGKTRIWNRMQLRALNNALLADPLPLEIRYNRSKRVLGVAEQVGSLTTFDLNLGVGQRSRAFLTPGRAE